VIEVLHQADFSVTLTADHGNVAVPGNRTLGRWRPG
jgi:hypothetical protein